MNQLTIVIPCYNEELYIGRTLRNIKRQKGLGDPRIIIADAGSTDSTLSIIETLSKQLSLQVEVIPGGKPAVGRNAGAKLATTDYLLFLDADVTFTNKQCVSQSLSVLEDSQVLMVGTCPMYMGEFDVRAKLIFAVNHLITWILSKTSPFAIGGYMMIRRATFNQLGGFDEAVHQSEDWLLSRQIEPTQFKFIPNLMTQDNRRFKKYGYFNMISLVIGNWINRNNPEHFNKNQNYWN